MTNKETTKDLREDLISKIDNIGGILTKLERVEFLLGELIGDYSFREKPNPLLIFDNNISSENYKLKKQAEKWFLEYDRIQTFIDMSLEYTLHSREDVERTLADLKTMWNIR